MVLEHPVSLFCIVSPNRSHPEQATIGVVGAQLSICLESLHRYLLEENNNKKEE